MRRISSITALTAAVAMRRAAVGAAVVARLEHGGHLARAQHAPTGKPLPIALAMRHDVGHDAGVLEAEPAAGAAEAGLHLVDHHQQRRARRTARGCPARYSAVAGMTPPSPCTGSISTAATLGSIGRGERVEVAEGHVAEALGHRLERLVLGRLAGGGERGEGAAVEAAERADDDVAARGRRTCGPA